VVGNVLYVRVPEDLKIGDTPPVTVSLKSGTVTYVGFRVFIPLKILDVVPGSASPGAGIVLSLSRPLNKKLPAKLFVGETATTFAPLSDPTAIQATVPDDASPGRLIISLLEGDVAAPYQRFTVIEKTFLGIGRSVWVKIGWTLFFLILAISAYSVANRSRSFDNLTKRYDAIQVQLGAEGTSVAGVPVIDIPSPDVPPELAQLCAARNCLLFAGPGLGGQTGRGSERSTAFR
jgi:hypothetical protein